MTQPAPPWASNLSLSGGAEALLSKPGVAAFEPASRLMWSDIEAS